MPSPPSTRPSDATGRRSSAFVHKDTETAAAPSTTTSRARVEGATDGGAGDCCRSPSVSEPATPLAPPRSRRSSAPCEALRHGCDAPGAATKPAEPRKQVSHTQAASALQLASVACRRWPGDVGGGGLGGLVPARRAKGNRLPARGHARPNIKEGLETGRSQAWRSGRATTHRRDDSSVAVALVSRGCPRSWKAWCRSRPGANRRRARCRRLDSRESSSLGRESARCPRRIGLDARRRVCS
jgi:hypothetical protein